MGMLKTLLTVVLMTAATVGLAAEGRFKIAYSTYLGGKHWEEAREIIGNHDAFIVKLVPARR